MPLQFVAWHGEKPRRFKDAQFRCYLNQSSRDAKACTQCKYIIPGKRGRPARRCKIKTCRVIGYCHHHRFKHVGLRTEDTSIRFELKEDPNHPEWGLGVYVKGPPGQVAFRAGEKVFKTGAKRITKRQLDRRYDKPDGTDIVAPYGFSNGQNGPYVYDSACNRDVGDYAQSVHPQADDPVYQTGQQNIELPRDPARSKWFTALRDIMTGEQLLVFYGDDYWDPQSEHIQHVTRRVPVARRRRRSTRNRRRR